MNRTAIKSFATQARRTLTDQVQARAAQFGITGKGIAPSSLVSGGMIVNGMTLNADETAQYIDLRDHLSELERSEGSLERAVHALVNEVAYTWFNRLTALRFMEVNAYSLRALSSSDPNLTDPDLLRDATTLVQNADLPGISFAQLEEWRRLYDDEGVYRRLLVAHCNTFAVGLPFLFSASLSYTALFLPANLLHSESLIRKLERDIPETDWQDIEIVGWLYQFYISDEKDRVIGGKGKYPARDIPAATQLFTPHWIVRYMVENSVGRLWLEAHPESNLRAHMPYYLESPPENPKPVPNPALRPEDLSVLDPACGSGHILVYAFDLLFEIYSERGYAEREIPQLILTHNLHGLDIDERAAQLASFAVTMKARAKNRRILREPPKLNILAVRASRHVKLELPKLPTQQHNMFEPKALAPAPLWTQTILPRDWQPLLEAFRDADNLGSLIAPPAFDDTLLESQVHALESEGGLFAVQLAPELRHTLEQARLLKKKYAAVVANPPYMGGGSFNADLKTFVEKKYPRSKSDLFAVFIERITEMTLSEGYAALVTMQSWMFLSSYEALRKHLLENFSIATLLHMDNNVMQIAFGTSAFVLGHGALAGYRGAFTWFEMSNLDQDLEVPYVFPAKNNRNEKAENKTRVFHADAREFEKIPGSPVAYWASKNIIN
jgi:N-6 DNA Methylase